MIARDAAAGKPPKGAPATFSYAAFAICVIVGLALGLAATRLHGPLRRSQAEPWQLGGDDRHHYTLAIALAYAHAADLPGALQKLIAMRPPQDPLDALAGAACALGGSGYLRSESGIRAIRFAVSLYGSHGRAGCADQLLPPATTPKAQAIAREAGDARAAATPLPTKPPLPQDLSQAPRAAFAPTPAPERSFEARAARSFCDIAAQALIEVHILDYLGRGIPGQRIRVRWGDQADVFISGLKRDRGDSYADFQMEEGLNYAIDMPDAAEPLGASLSTGACYSENRRALKSWRVTFVET